MKNFFKKVDDPNTDQYGYDIESYNSKKIRNQKWNIAAMGAVPVMVTALLLGAIFYGNSKNEDTKAAVAVSKTQVVDYLQSLSNTSGSAKKMVAGQHIGQTSNYTATDRGTPLIENMATKMGGEYVGMVGADLGGNSGFDTGLSDYITSYWNSGGLVTISWHRKNPATGGTEKDTSVNPIPAILSADASAAKTEYYRQLDSAATSLQRLQDNGVIVLYRPFHEMTINAFWWGCGDQEQFKQLWRTEYDYLTNTKGLNNLVWVWAPHRSHSCTSNPHLGYYPGAEYVDVAGLDAYECINATTKVWGGSALKTLYDQIVTLGKPVAFTEVGESRSACRLSVYSDYRTIFNTIKSQYPRVGYFIVWNADMSYEYNDQLVDGVYSSQSALQDSAVISRGEHSIFNPTAPPPQINLSTSSASSVTGQSAMITWSASNNPTSCTASGDWSGDKASSGTETSGVFTTARTYTYTLSCTNPGGTSTNSTSIDVVSAPEPKLSITGLTNNTTVSNTMYAEAVPENISTVNKIDFFIDNRLINTETQSPYVLGGKSANVANGYDTKLLTNGAHTLRAVMTYNTDQTLESTVAFNVSNVVISTNQLIQAENAMYLNLASSALTDLKASDSKAVMLGLTGSWASHTFTVPQDGVYTIGGMLRSQDYKGSAIVAVQVNGKQVLSQYASSQGYKAVEVKNLNLKAGTQQSISFQFTNDKYDGSDRKDRSLWIDTIYFNKQ